MKIIACSSINDETIIVPFLEYIDSYSRESKNKKIQEKHIKQKAQIIDTIKYLYEHKGASNLPPLIEPYKDCEFSVIKITQADKLVRIAFKTFNNEILLLNVMEKPKLYEKALKNKVDKEIQQFLDDAKQIFAFYIAEHRGIDITELIIAP